MDNTANSKSPLKIIIEIIAVLATAFAVKWVAHYFEITGAGSIGIWSAVLVATLFMKQRKIRWRDLGLRWPKCKRAWIINLLWALLVVIASFLIIGLVLYPLLSVFGIDNTAVEVDAFNFLLGKPLVFITYLIVVVWFGAALGEELLMRGYLLSRLTDVVGSTKLGCFVAIIIQAAIFGMLHSYQGVVGILTTALVAIIFGLVYFVAKRRLFPLILAHGIIDTISLTAFYLSNGAMN